MVNYGNEFSQKQVPAVGAERINVWDKAEEFYPSGAVFVADTDFPVGSVIPAGTAVTVATPGGSATLNGSSPTGLSYEDVVVGTIASTITVVTRGTFLASRSNAKALTTTQENALKGRILIVKEA
jgi:hypothetical protein